MNSLVNYAKRELDIAFPDKEDKMQQHAIKNVLELIETFSNQGHSNFSAPYVLNLFDRLAHWKPISPLTGDDNEWEEISDEYEQNKRYFSVFRKNHDNSTAYDLDGKVFVDKDGFGYTNHNSRVPITFPYEIPDKPEFVKEGEN